MLDINGYNFDAIKITNDNAFPSTYTTTEHTVPEIDKNKDIELMKKNGDLIGKYLIEFEKIFEKEDKKNLHLDILDKLNEFSYERDKLYANVPTVSIPSVWTTKDLKKDKAVKTTIATTINSKTAEAYNKIIKQQREKMRNLTPSEEEKYQNAISKVYEQNLNNDADKSLGDTNKQLNAIKNSEFDKKPNPKEYCRSYSLTNEDVKKMDDWITKHDKKHHKKGYGYQGAVGVSRHYVEFMSTSIGVGADCVCKECNKKYEKTKQDLEEVKKELYNSTEDKKKVLRKKIAKLSKEENNLYKQSHFEIRGIDD